MTRLILIVDDSPEIRTSVGEMLQEDGFAVVLSEDGQAALERLQSGLRPDVILLDLMMPRLDGAQFRERQLSDPKLKDIPVVLMTAVRNFDDRPLKVKRVLKKPFTIEALLAAIEGAQHG